MRIKVMRENKNKIRAYFKNGTNTSFSFTGENLGGVPIFKDSSNKTMKILREQKEQKEQKIKGILNRHNPEIILACSDEFLKKVIRATQENEIDVDIFITESREIFHYIALSLEQKERKEIITILLISYDD